MTIKKKTCEWEPQLSSQIFGGIVCTHLFHLHRLSSCVALLSPSFSFPHQLHLLHPFQHAVLHALSSFVPFAWLPRPMMKFKMYTTLDKVKKYQPRVSKTQLLLTCVIRSLWSASFLKLWSWKTAGTQLNYFFKSRFHFCLIAHPFYCPLNHCVTLQLPRL